MLTSTGDGGVDWAGAGDTEENEILKKNSEPNLFNVSKYPF
jgi:hypothetical protein